MPAFPELRRVQKVSVSDGAEGLRVLRILDACQARCSTGHRSPAEAAPQKDGAAYFVHESAYVDEGAEIGAGPRSGISLIS